jgi:hypothetical protein
MNASSYFLLCEFSSVLYSLSLYVKLLLGGIIINVLLCVTQFSVPCKSTKVAVKL